MENIRRQQQIIAKIKQEEIMMKMEQEKRMKIEKENKIRIEQEKIKQAEKIKQDQLIKQMEQAKIEQEKRRKIELDIMEENKKRYNEEIKNKNIIIPPSKPMISNIDNNSIAMPITGSPVSSTNKLPINNGVVNNNPSIKSTFLDTLNQEVKLTNTQNLLLTEIRKLEDIVNQNIKNISETTNETNTVLAEIKQIETDVQNNINIPDNLERANKISSRLEELEKSVKSKIKSKTVIDLLTNRIHFILGSLHKKIIQIKKSDKGILDLLPIVIVDIISFLINFMFLILPILIIGFLIIYVIFSESEYAIAIKEWIQNLFNFKTPIVEEE